MRRLIQRSFCALVLSLTCCSFALADWPQFLGENRDGTSDETGLLDAFPDGGPEVVWRVPGGVGMSAVTVSGNLAMTTFNESGNQVLVAMDTKTGKRVWQTPIGRAYKNGQGDGPRATCLLYTSPSPRDQRGSRMPSSA